jgi:hypothetical protein
VADEDHHIENLVGDGLDDEEVGRPNPVEMVLEEGPPGLGPFSARAAASDTA